MKTLAATVFRTYNLYHDAQSRIETMKTLEAVCCYSGAVLPELISSIYAVATDSKVIAVTGYLSLLNWINRLSVLLAQTANKAFFTPEVVLQLVRSQALLTAYGLEGCSNETESDKKKPQHRRRVRDSVVASTKLAIFATLTEIEDKYALLDAYVKITTDPKASAAANVVFLAIMADALVDLQPTEPALFNYLLNEGTSRATIIEYYSSQVVLAKSAISAHHLSLFSSHFVNSFVLNDDLTGTVLMALEKAVLRSSDAFAAVAIPLFSDLNTEKFNLSKYLPSSKLFQFILSAFKAPKEEVRDTALVTFEQTLRLSSLEAREASALVLELLKTLKATLNVDSKSVILRGVAAIKCPDVSVLAHVVTSLLPLVAKDQNETSLAGLVLSFTGHFIQVLLQKGTVDESAVLKQFQAGASDKKLPLRRVWFLQLAETLYNNDKVISNELVAQFLEKLYPTLMKSLDEAQQAPLPSVTNKGIACALTTIALSEGLPYSDPKKVFLDSLQAQGDKVPLLTSPKVLAKLSGSELTWASRALVSVLGNLSDLLETDQLAYGLAWLYMCISKNVSHETRREALHLLKQALISEPKFISTSVIDGIYSILEAVDAGTVDETLQYDVRNIAPLFALLTQVPKSPFVAQNLRRLLVVANHRHVPTKNEWVGLVQRSGSDVGALVTQNADAIVDACYAHLGRTRGALYDASVRALATVAFIAPAQIAPALAARADSDLAVAKFASLESELLRIYAGVEGELVVDVLAHNTKRPEDKNTKDYETRKWEESMRKELAAKNKGVKKLTREEETQVSTQLVKESSVRAEMRDLVDAAERGLAVVTQLALAAAQVDNGAQIWYPRAARSVLALAEVPQAQELLGAQVARTYQTLAQLTLGRLGLLREALGAASLRIYGVPVAELAAQEPLLAQLGRILFRVKILADQRPLDALSLAYLFPLLTQVLENGKAAAFKNSKKQAVTSEFAEEDPEEEQLLLAVEIVLAHADAFEDALVPRIAIFSVLIALMKLPARAKLAKECFLAMCQHVSVLPTPEDVQFLMDQVISPEPFVRSAVLEVLDAEFDLLGDYTYSSELWIAAHDTDAHSASVAATIWDDNDFQLAEDAPVQLLVHAGAADLGLRLSVARAVVACVEELARTQNGVFARTIDDLVRLYHDKENPPPPPVDKFGLPIKSAISTRDPWEWRSTVAQTLRLSAHLFDEPTVNTVFRFLVDEKALGDKDDIVRQELVDAGVQIVRIHGLAHVEALIPICEACLGEKDQNLRQQDNIRQLVIILYGALASYLDADDDRLALIVDRLVKTLDTPSEDVQYAVSQTLAPLAPALARNLRTYLDKLFTRLFTGAKLAHRRGAAYGIAGLVKGAGILALATHDIMRTITDAADDAKTPQKREGVAFAFDCLSQALGRFFEPYVIEVLPIILKQLGDTAPEVREATDMAARQIMKATTLYGVKKLIPVAVANLDDIQWRLKKGLVELLGSMAYLDPTQLSALLLTIIPEIVGVLNDTHKEVRKAADAALKRFGEVIRNPEIQEAVPVLVKAIGDPTGATDAALDALIKTQFVHYIDGASLALIIHVIHRGMKDRSASTKKKACQIVGNMAILVDARDLRPYLGSIVSELEVAMVDPVPATRSTAARALGSLVEKLGEEQFPDLIPRLLDTLKDESRVGDRLGSAQALSEVICGLGVAKLDQLLPQILALAALTRAHVRAGFMPLLLFLPVCFGTLFAPYLARIIPPILNGLADTDEDIRDTALRAGRLIVKNYATKAVDLLLPELENGLQDSLYRIRLSLVELTGDLLFQVTGISGKSDAEELDALLAVNATLVDVLGQERRDRVLAALFVCRADVTGIVRAAAVDIWKALVANTPRTVKEIIPTLTALIVRKLALQDETQRAIAAAALGETVRRVGALALQALLPTLEELLNNADTDVRAGICIALTELIAQALQDALAQFHEVFVRILRAALVDPAPAVRAAAAQAFDALQERLGREVVDDIVPHLLAMLDSDNAEGALLALRELMAARADVIFPILLPALLPPLDAFKARALAQLAQVAGPALYRRLGAIISALVDASLVASEDLQPALAAAFDSVLVSVDDDEGVHPLMQHVLALIKHEDVARRRAIYARLGAFFAATLLDISVYLQDVVSQLVLSLGDKEQAIVEGSFEALSALIKRQPKELLEKLVKPVREALYLTGVQDEDLAGFTLLKGPSCILPVFLHGLMYGSSDQKEASALGIADIISKTPAANLKPFATTMTGPLIRVIGEKVTSDIKAGILVALTKLLEKIPQFLRPFIPQLQRTFVRSLLDPQNATLRARAVRALGVLIAFQPRVDLLVTELVSGARNSDEIGVKTSMLDGMLEVVGLLGSNMNEASRAAVMSLVEEELAHGVLSLSVSYARLLGALLAILSEEEASAILRSKVLAYDGSSAKFAVLATNAFLKDAPTHIFAATTLPDVVSAVIEWARSSEEYVGCNGVVAIGKLLLLHEEKKSPFLKPTESPLLLPEEHISALVTELAGATVTPASSETRRLALVALRTVARHKYALVKPHWDTVVPLVFTCLRDAVIPIRLASEKAYLSLFNLVDDEAQEDFSGWFAQAQNGPLQNSAGATVQARSIGDYTKRVASRLAGVERERIEAGGDAETMFSDRYEDESEVWAVGGIDMKSI